MPTQFYDDGVTSRLADRRRLSRFLDALVLEKTGAIKSPQLACIFHTDAALLEMNIQFLDHNTLTDIITFDNGNGEGRLQGELHISTDRVAENASAFQVSYDEELHRVIFHGVLHLCGYKDKTKKDIAAMRAAEAACLLAYSR